ncbi:hypothetical protein HKCCE4037_03170 [Rhodobacterales bacterium HKCCE4037]|nr:hypothetical protein [Rhodobacterales bacterium HKCCE4037]
MRGVLEWLLGRPRADVHEGAKVHLFLHAHGIVLQPYRLRATSNGSSALRVCDPDRWRRMSQDTRGQDLGLAVLETFGRIGKPNRRDHGTLSTSEYDQAIRSALSLNSRAPLWKGTGMISVRVREGLFVVVPMRPAGTAGGYADVSGAVLPRLEVSNATPQALGAILDLAADLALRAAEPS